MTRTSMSSSRCELLNEDDKIQLKVPVAECNVAVTDLFSGATGLEELSYVGCSGLHYLLEEGKEITIFKGT